MKVKMKVAIEYKKWINGKAHNFERIPCRYCSETIEIVGNEVVENCGHFVRKSAEGIIWRIFPLASSVISAREVVAMKNANIEIMISELEKAEATLESMRALLKS